MINIKKEYRLGHNFQKEFVYIDDDIKSKLIFDVDKKTGTLTVYQGELFSISLNKETLTHLFRLTEDLLDDLFAFEKQHPPMDNIIFQPIKDNIIKTNQS